MKDNLLWGAGAVVIIILAVVLFGSNSKAPVTIEENTNLTPEETVKSTTSGTKVVTSTPAPKVEEFTNIFPQKGNFKCVYEEVSPSKRSTHTMYFSDGKMRVESRTLSGSSNIMFYDGRYMYNWVEGQGTGTLSQPKAISDFPAIIPKDITSGKVLGSGLDSASWDCFAWAKDSSLVTKPSYVIFN